MGTQAITILNRTTGRAVKAELLDGLVPEDLMLLESEWVSERSRVLQDILRAGDLPDHRPQSLRWNWRAKAQHLRFTQASGFAVVCEERWQGAMLTKSAIHFTRIGDNRGKPLVYIDYLEVAPWNWTIPGIGQSGQFARVGRHLFAAAVRQSQDAGFGGRIGLHTLSQSARFYCDVCGMIPLGKDKEKEGLEYFELTESQAEYIVGRSE